MEKRHGFVLLLILVPIILLIFLPKKRDRVDKLNKQDNLEMVKIDSVKLEKTTTVLPEKVWVHYTKNGPSIISKDKIYESGDTIYVPYKK
jgi:hypothetical protein